MQSPLPQDFCATPNLLDLVQNGSLDLFLYHTRPFGRRRVRSQTMWTVVPSYPMLNASIVD
jgi:hypothetical protein